MTDAIDENGASRSSAQADRIWRAATAVPVLTVFLLIVLDLVLRQGNFIDAMGFHTVDVWGLPARLELCKKTAPDVALVGSSLLLVLNQDEQGRHFYSGVYPPHFQELLSRSTRQPVTCINLCTGLQMPSETYLIAEAVMGQSNHPPVMILGIALRDFIHDQYALEWSCDSFASIAPYVPLSLNVLSQMSSATAVRELVLCHIWYLYRDRIDFKSVLSAWTKNFLELLPLDMPYPRLGFDHTWRPQRRGFLHETWVPRQQEKFTEEIYRTRPQFLKRFFRNMQAGIYRQGSESTMRLQTHYLEALIRTCQERDVQLVVVNMPLSPEFQRLVPPGLYDTFGRFLRYFASFPNVAVIDFYNQPEFGDDAFKDGVHLNYGGARRFAEKLAQKLAAEYPAVVQAVAVHAQARQALAGRDQLEAPYRQPPAAR